MPMLIGIFESVLLMPYVGVMPKASNDGARGLNNRRIHGESVQTDGRRSS